MGSRKDTIKRSLGITEYPWSSGDELEEAPETTNLSTSRRPPAEQPHPPAPEAPGPSGTQVTFTPPPQLLQQQQRQSEQQQAAAAASNRRQMRHDRDLFWSIINSRQRAQLSRSRTSSEPVRLGSVPAPEMWPSAFRGTAGTDAEHPRRTDWQRIAEFKQLTRNLSLRLRSNELARNRGNPSEIVPSEANSSVVINRPARLARSATFRLESPATNGVRRISIPMRPSSFMDDFRAMVNDGLVTCRGRVQGAGARSARTTAAAERDLLRPARSQPDPEPEPQPEHAPLLVHSSEDEVNNNPTVTSAVDPDTLEVNEDQDVSMEGDLEAEPIDSQHVTLEEEIMAIDLPEQAQVSSELNTAVPSGDQDETDGRFSEEFRRNSANGDANLINNNCTSATEASEQAANQNSADRERRQSIENTEPGTVKEFNQNLLRLLECPVCLEWMEPPMSQCRRGHLVCGVCRARLANCPVCRTTFSSVRNRAMEGVAELLRYPCRHGCGREVRLRKRTPHEASCVARKYQCPAPACSGAVPLPRSSLAHHFQSHHLTMIKFGSRHNISIKVNSELHDNWIVMTMAQYFHLKIDVDIRTWGIVVLVSYIGPKREAKNYTYEVKIQHNQRRLVYARTTHSDLEKPSLNICCQDCFHITLDQAINFLRVKNRRSESEKYLDFSLEIAKVERESVPLEESDS